jgi:MFS family permease
MLAGTISFSRAARIAVSTFFFVAGICFASWASRIPDIQHHLHFDDGQLGSVLFALPVGSMLSLPVAGFLVTKFGSRIVMFVGSFFLCKPALFTWPGGCNMATRYCSFFLWHERQSYEYFCEHAGRWRRNIV